MIRTKIHFRIGKNDKDPEEVIGASQEDCWGKILHRYSNAAKAPVMTNYEVLEVYPATEWADTEDWKVMEQERALLLAKVRYDEKGLEIN